jgi:hypothetical protein
MSNQLPQPDDFTQEEKDSLESYIKNGCPGLVKMTDTDAFKCFELYMSGKSYLEISQITNIKRDTVLYLSNKSKWNEKRIKYISDIANNLTQKLTNVKVENLNTLATIATALGKYYNKKMNQYLSTNDDSVIETLDTKLLSQYYKAMDAITGDMSGSSERASTNVNINLGEGGTVRKVDSDTVEITNSSEMLKALAMLKRSNVKLDDSE